VRVLGRAGVLRKKALAGDLPVVWCGSTFPSFFNLIFFLNLLSRRRPSSPSGNRRGELGTILFAVQSGETRTLQERYTVKG
jgi:hypothetical protein